MNAATVPSAPAALPANNAGMNEDTPNTASPAPPAPPDRLSSDPRSPHHAADTVTQHIGIRFNDKERFDVEEYCVSEGWIKVPAGKAKDRRGQPLTIKLKGAVTAFYR